MYLTYRSVAEGVSAVMANQARVAVVEVEGEGEEERLDTALASVASAVVVTVTRQEVRVREAASGAGAGCRLVYCRPADTSLALARQFSSEPCLAVEV